MALTNEQLVSYSQKSEVHTKAKEFWNYVTGSAGGWPTLSRTGIIAGLDFTIESGSENVYFFSDCFHFVSDFFCFFRGFFIFFWNFLIYF